MTNALARKFGLGRLLYQTFHRPIGAVQQSLREGGPLEQARDRAGHEAMKAAAIGLPSLRELPIGPQAEIAFLSGPRYWHQTVFCFVSLQLNMPFRITPVIYDDGAMDGATMARIRQVVPWARFVLAGKSEQDLDALLPEAAYPMLRARRRVYPHLRKLLDIHVKSTGFRLVADSDMLFFRRPDALVHWFNQPHWFHIQDIETAYGYPLGFLSELARGSVPEAVNVGLYAIDGAAIDWDRVEYWCRRQIETYGPQYLQEQALTAMLFAHRAAVAPSREEFVVMPDAVEAAKCTAVLHHYVHLSKRAYYRHNWQRIAALAFTA